MKEYTIVLHRPANINAGVNLNIAKVRLLAESLGCEFYDIEGALDEVYICIYFKEWPNHGYIAKLEINELYKISDVIRKNEELMKDKTYKIVFTCNNSDFMNYQNSVMNTTCPCYFNSSLYLGLKELFGLEIEVLQDDEYRYPTIALKQVGLYKACIDIEDHCYTPLLDILNIIEEEFKEVMKDDE